MPEDDLASLRTIRVPRFRTNRYPGFYGQGVEPTTPPVSLATVPIQSRAAGPVYPGGGESGGGGLEGGQTGTGAAAAGTGRGSAPGIGPDSEGFSETTDFGFDTAAGLSNAAKGLGIGLGFGPIGAALGAAIGLSTGFFSKDEDPNDPESPADTSPAAAPSSVGTAGAPADAPSPGAATGAEEGGLGGGVAGPGPGTAGAAADAPGPGAATGAEEGGLGGGLAGPSPGPDVEGSVGSEAGPTGTAGSDSVGAEAGPAGPGAGPGSEGAGAGADGGGCYVTTAVAQNANDPVTAAGDLQTLKQWRDNVLTKTPMGQMAAQVYYQTAPQIASDISNRPDAQQVFQQLHQGFIRPAVDAIRGGNDAQALQIYMQGLQAAKAAATQPGGGEQAAPFIPNQQVRPQAPPQGSRLATVPIPGR